MVLIRTASLRRFYRVPTNYVLSNNTKILVVKFSIYLNRRIFVMANAYCLVIILVLRSFFGLNMNRKVHKRFVVGKHNILVHLHNEALTQPAFIFEFLFLNCPFIIKAANTKTDAASRSHAIRSGLKSHYVLITRAIRTIAIMFG